MMSQRDDWANPVTVMSVNNLYVAGSFRLQNVSDALLPESSVSIHSGEAKEQCA